MSPSAQLWAGARVAAFACDIADPAAVALSVFGAITVAGLSAAVEGPSADPSADAARFSAAITELVLDGLATPGSRDQRRGDPL